MSVGISLAIIGSVCFAGTIAWLTYEVISAPIRDDWETCTKSRDQQYRDRIASGGKSFRDALALSDNECGDWPVITEEQLLKLHGGEQS